MRPWVTFQSAGRSDVISSRDTVLLQRMRQVMQRWTRMWTCGIAVAALASGAAQGRAQFRSGENKLAAAPPVTYANRYELFGGINYQNDQAGQNLPKRVNLAGVEALGTYWVTGKLGVALDLRGEAGTTAVFPNTDPSKPVVVLYTGMAGVQYRGPKGQRAAINYHAYGGVSHGDFTETARQDVNIGLYTNRTKPMFAAGASVDFNRTKNVAVRVSPDIIVERFGTETREFFAISAGLIYRFGSR